MRDGASAKDIDDGQGADGNYSRSANVSKELGFWRRLVLGVTRGDGKEHDGGNFTFPDDAKREVVDIADWTKLSMESISDSPAACHSPLKEAPGRFGKGPVGGPPLCQARGRGNEQAREETSETVNPNYPTHPRKRKSYRHSTPLQAREVEEDRRTMSFQKQKATGQRAFGTSSGH